LYRMAHLPDCVIQAGINTDVFLWQCLKLSCDHYQFVASACTDGTTCSALAGDGHGCVSV